MNRRLPDRLPMAPQPARRGFLLFSSRELLVVTALVAGLFLSFERLQQALRLAPANRLPRQPPVHQLFVDKNDGDLWVLRHSSGLTRRTGRQLDEVDGLLFDAALTQCAVATDDPSRMAVLVHQDGMVELFLNRRRIAQLPATVVDVDLPSRAAPTVSTTPSGDVVSAADPSGLVHLWRIKNDEVSEETQHLRRPIERAELSPDGRMLLVISRRSLFGMWDLETQSWLRLGETGHPFCSGWALSPDGARLATVGSDRLVRVWNLRRGKVDWKRQVDILDPAGVSFSPCGRFVATGGYSNHVRVWSADNGDVVGDYVGHTQAPRVFAWSTDSRRLYSSGLDGEVLSWDVAAAQ